MKCLHLCNDLLGSEVHQHLYRHLAEAGLDQVIFYPLRRHKLSKAAEIGSRDLPPVIISKMLRRYHRIFFRRKISWLYDDLRSKTDLNEYTIVHATTLLSDGAIAFRIYQDFGIPYVVAVRGTDFALSRRRPDLNFLGTRIINNASKVFCVSEALRQRLFQHKIYARADESAREKIITVPNGVSPFWLSHIETQRETPPRRILYVGNFSTGKNVLKLAKAVLLLRDEYPELTLSLVGPGGTEEEPILHLAQDNPDCITYHGPEHDRSKLRQHYLKNDLFAMPSVRETFGLVYVEALTQGLPILFTKGDGIDGSIDQNVGRAVDPSTPESIAIALRQMLDQYQEFELDKVDFDNFSWTTISGRYLSIYESFSN